MIYVGDINPGAAISSNGNIIVLGALKGNAVAGASGNRDAFVFALDMNPM
ncbi:MAG: septum site-determining protein MinC, partial [Lachnospiraceae bacterium]|nr:septum site-determining protein MinC [Lachnospiraceae bacterium]